MLASDIVPTHPRQIGPERAARAAESALIGLVAYPLSPSGRRGREFKSRPPDQVRGHFRRQRPRRSDTVSDGAPLLRALADTARYVFDVVVVVVLVAVVAAVATGLGRPQPPAPPPPVEPLVIDVKPLPDPPSLRGDNPYPDDEPVYLDTYIDRGEWTP